MAWLQRSQHAAGSQFYPDMWSCTSMHTLLSLMCCVHSYCGTRTSWRKRSLIVVTHGLTDRDVALPAEGNGDLQTLICVLVARPRRCLTLSNPVPWQNWMAAYLGYILRMRTLFRGWPIMVNDTHTRRRRRLKLSLIADIICLKRLDTNLTMALYKSFTYLVT